MTKVTGQEKFDFVEDALTRLENMPVSREELLEILLPGLEKLFGAEYEKYKTEHNLSEEDMYLSLTEGTDDI